MGAGVNVILAKQKQQAAQGKPATSAFKGTPAEIADQKEAQRLKNIQKGQQSIDKSFEGFNKQFYKQHRDDYINYYGPQLNDQYQDAVKRLTLQLARTGNLSGQVGIDQLADLKRKHDIQNTAIQNQAVDVVRNLQSNVANRKSALYADNRAAADPGSAAAAAASVATSLQPAAPTSPLANVFSEFFNNLGNINAIANVQRNPFSQTGGVTNFTGNTGVGNGGSVLVVR